MTQLKNNMRPSGGFYVYTSVGREKSPAIANKRKFIPMTNACDDLAEAFKRTEDRLRGYLRKRLPQDSQVDDVLQDVLLKALESLYKGQTIDNHYGWLQVATRTTLADYYRARKSHETLDDTIPEQLGDDLDRHQELSSCLSPMIEQLPDHYRNTLRALDLQGKKQQELANTEGVSVSAIKSRASRGRKLLKQQLMDCCHISIENGLVSDFYKREACGCKER